MRRGFLAASSDSGAAAEGGRTVQRSPRPASLSSWLGPTFECEEPPGLSSWETDTVWDQTACRVAGSVRAPLSAFPPAFVEQALLPTNQLFFAQYSLAVEPDREQPRYVDCCAGALGGHGKRLWVSKLQWWELLASVQVLNTAHPNLQNAANGSNYLTKAALCSHSVGRWCMLSTCMPPPRCPQQTCWR